MIEKHETIESTQLLLKEKLDADPELPHHYAILARVQTGGKGRAGHDWISTRGNLHASILLQKLPFSEITWIPHWVSACVLSALVDLGVDGSRVQLKWPNDLWIDREKKTAGILCEKISSSVIIGIGLNLVNAPSVAQETGSISQIGSVLLADLVLERILLELTKPVTVAVVREVYEKHALFKVNDAIEWKNSLSGEAHEGMVHGLGIHGELMVNSDGKKLSLFTEDVRAARLK